MPLKRLRYNFKSGSLEHALGVCGDHDPCESDQLLLRLAKQRAVSAKLVALALKTAN
jgi:hypothetical protein